MKTLYILYGAVVVFFLAACAAPNTILVNPSTGEYMNCAAAGWGWAGAPLAQMSHNNCVESLKSIGYLPVKDVVPGVLTITSDPPDADIYAGQSAETLKLVGKTPYRMIHPQKSRLWAGECYQIKKTGYAETAVDCYDQVWGDRSVYFNLEKVGKK